MIRRVCSTSDFKEAGKRKNGDLYDYSKSDFRGSDEPIVIGCKRCGKWLVLKNAASHYLKGCGCKSCNMERKSPCKKCGVAVSSKNYHVQRGFCLNCFESAKTERLERRSLKHGKSCKTCGKWFVHKDRFYCSKECRESKPKRVNLRTCSRCGVEFLRECSREKAQRLNFCSVRCQNEFQRNNYFAYHPNATRAIPKDKSAQVRRKWHKERSAERRLRSVAFAWWKKCKESVAAIDGQVVSPWDRRITSAAALLRERAEPTFKLERVKIMTWDATLRNAMKEFSVDPRSIEEKRWSRKISNAVKSLARRFEAQSKRRIGNYGTSTRETSRKLLLNVE